MKLVLRTIGGILAGALAWAVLWNLGTRGAQLAFPQHLAEGVAITHSGILIGFILYSVALSVLAGWITGLTAGARARLAVWLLAVLQMSLGLAFQISFWQFMPVWYHLIFLALIIPATVYGGTLAWAKRAAPPPELAVR